MSSYKYNAFHNSATTIKLYRSASQTYLLRKITS